ncbi:MAG: ABC transporter ATP-binding protein [Gammaproteobacteria bacterium]|nr:ABC transporter ATP-binding protein [Gammaproteobacteria bacterium]
MSLQLKQISKTVGAHTHIYPTDVELQPGMLNTLLGTTLSGKTTLMQLMAGLDAPSTGEIWFNGKNVTHVPVQKRNVSMVYQQFINYPMMNVFDNIASPLRVARYQAADIKQRVGDVAELLRISELLDRKPSELSGGQQQRCAMARALVKESDLILLDEPLANLDFKLREELRDELPRLLSERDCVAVYATTEPTEAVLLGGCAAAMHEGRIAQFGPTSDIYRRPQSLISAQVFSEPPINVAEVEHRDGWVHLSDSVSWAAQGEAAGLKNGRYTFAIRPHHVSPSAQGVGVPIDAVVEVAELSGSESVIHFSAFERPWISQSHGVHPYRAGEHVKMFAQVEHGFYFDTAGALVAA